MHALFHPAEDARGYFLLLEAIVRRSGITIALYSDRHGVFKASPDGRKGLKVSTQFARAMRELGIFSCCPAPDGRATPGRGSRWWSARTASSPSSTRGRRSPRARHRPARSAGAPLSELARNPDHERIASGLGSGGTLRRLPAIRAAATVEVASNGTTARPGAGGTEQLRAPTPRQLARWKAIQQAQLQGLSLRATARLLGISRVTVTSYVRANGVPGRRNGASASSHGSRRTDGIAVQLH